MSTVSAVPESGPPFGDRRAAAGRGWSEQGDKTANGAHEVSSKCDVDNGSLLRVERLNAADALSLS